jgi:aryl-alcohol dehydrogenase-like predicted oxidoreductase
VRPPNIHVGAENFINFDCSLYGDSEELLGKWFKRTAKRDEIFLATKFGYVKGADYSVIDSSAKYCKEACENSLKALGTDYIDLCEHYLNSGLDSED